VHVRQPRALAGVVILNGVNVSRRMGEKSGNAGCLICR